MKTTFKADKSGRNNLTAVDSVLKLSVKRLSLKPKSMTRSKSLKPFAVSKLAVLKTQK